MSSTEGSTEQAAPASDRGTIASLVLAASRYTGTALKHPHGDGWREISYPDMRRSVREIAKGLMALGVETGDRVAILSNTRVEWTLADLAAMAAGAVVVPVYQTNSPEECLYVLDHSGSTVVFCEDADQVAKLREVRDELPGLRQIIVFDREHDSEDTITLDELRASGADITDEQLTERADTPGPDDTATIVYTSGTTGPPKGCMLSHANLRGDVEMVRKRVEFSRTDHDVVYIFLPLAHVLSRIVQLTVLDAGAVLAYWHSDPKRIVSDVGEIAPTHLPSVPRVFEKIYTAATSKVEAAGGPKEKLFWWAVGVGRKVRERERKGGRNGLVLDAQYKLADKLVLHKVRDLFGGRIKLALTGAAPIDVDILSFFHACGVWVLEGYGMTETSAVATLNTIEEHRLGTVGRPLPGCEVKIAEDGEILMRGQNIFRGYYNNEEATAATLSDGWLLSGDLGELDADGYLKITGRKKDLIITSSGKNVSPSNIENAMHAVSLGLPGRRLRRPPPVPDGAGDARPRRGQGARREGRRRRRQPRQAREEPRRHKEIQQGVDEANRRFARIEQVKRWAILERDLTQEHGELTPSLKIKRNVVYKDYADRFKALYDAKS